MLQLCGGSGCFPIREWWLRQRQTKLVESQDLASKEEAPTRDRAAEKAWHKAQDKARKEAEKARDKARKEVDRAQKRLRTHAGAKAQLSKLQQQLHQAYEGCPVAFAAIDVEAWEKDGEKLTEIGLALVLVDIAPKSEAGLTGLTVTCSFRHRHFLIEEYIELRNGKYVADAKDDFIFGDSELMSLQDAVLELSAELRAVDYLVGHALHGDVAWLQSAGVELSAQDGRSLESRMVDTQVLAAAFVAEVSADSLQQRSLASLAMQFELNPHKLHNAANDAAFTLQVMLSQLGVAFQPPVRGISRHASSERFRAAMALAEVRMQAAVQEQLTRDQSLRAQVADFAEQLQARPPAVDENGQSLASGQELQFPAHLTSADRKVVHQACEELGFTSVSRNGPSGERYVVICLGISLRKGPPDGGWPKQVSGGGRRGGGGGGRGGGGRRREKNSASHRA